MHAQACNVTQILLHCQVLGCQLAKAAGCKPYEMLGFLGGHPVRSKNLYQAQWL